MRILHVIDSGGLYGAEVVTLNLMEAQEKMGLLPTLLSIGDTGVGPKDIEIEAKKHGLEIQILRFRNGLNLKGSMMILNYARSLRSEIIHSHGYKANILLGIIPRRFRRMPVIATLHGWTSRRFFTKIWVYEWIDVLAMRNLDRVIAVSSAVEKNIRMRSVGIHPIVINNGLPRLDFEKDSFARECPEISEKCKGKFKIISIGRLSPEKGFNILIQAMTRLVSQGVDASLVLVGDGSERDSLSDLVNKENLSDRVHFIGYRDKAFNLIPYFDVFVISSYSEGLPITLLEAMQAGVPVVTTSVGEIPEVLGAGQFGTLVATGDPGVLAKALEDVYTNRGGAKLRAIAARDRVLTKYSVEKMASKYFEEYQTLVSRK